MNSEQEKFVYGSSGSRRLIPMEGSMNQRAFNRNSNMDRTRKRILLADDDQGVREMLGRLLETESYEVIFARTGSEATVKYAAEDPDLVLLDLNMPGIDGWAVFGFMNYANPLLPVIMITALPNQYRYAMNLGVDAFMEKPLNMHLLLEEIKRLLSESRDKRMGHMRDPDFKTAFLKNSN